MMAGPQIISALIFMTSRRAVAVSAAFVVAVALTAAVGVMITTWLAGLLPIGSGADEQDGTLVKVIELLLVALLIGIAVKNWVRRGSAAPPGWLRDLMSASPGRAFLTGALLIGLFPSDVIVLLTVGVHLAGSGESFSAALPFIGATTLIAALPLLSYVVFRRRAERAMPAVRDWMMTHTWLINIGACLLFIALILF